MIEIDWELYYTLEESMKKTSESIRETARNYLIPKIREAKKEYNLNKELFKK